ncbi:MAG: helix-turn-helix domain-containing protein [Polyangiaceae bacterium]
MFAKRGYHATKIEDIVVAADVARGTFYLYFEDKRAVFGEIVDRTLAKLAMAILRVDPHDPSRSVADQVRKNIRRVVRIFSKTARRRRSSCRRARRRRSIRSQGHSFTDEIAKLLMESLADGQALGLVVRGDVTLLACMTLGALSCFTRSSFESSALPEEAVVEALFAFLSQGLLRVAL